MKRFYYFLAGLFPLISGFTISPPVVKGYAYTQVTLSAVRIGGISEETGQASDRVRERISWLLFLEYKNSQTITPTVAWIQGKPYTLRVEKTDSNSVVINRRQPGKQVSDTLVAKTTNKILRFYPDKISTAKLPASISKRVSKSNIVVEYYWKSKKCYYTIASIKKLEPVALD
ncbi:MAG TPA: hypothetical protein VM012_11470 [Flavitalea sp.]|nr:hypothetical protein [Flavitalea sp.]